MKRLLSIIGAMGIVTMLNAQEALHIRSYWSSYDVLLENVDSITMGTPSHSDKLPALMASDPNISLFYEALLLTGMADSLNVCYDYSYTGPTDEEFRYVIDYRGRNGERAAALNHSPLRFTAFVEPNSVYARYGIYTINDLKAYAAKVYDEVYPEDASITDPADRRNSLNRFVSYHLLDRYCDTQSLVAATMREGLENCLMIGTHDAYDCYETMMPHSLMKISYGRRTQFVHYINRKYGTFNGGDVYTITGAPLITDNCDNLATNGVYHCINDIICYDAQTQYGVLNGRLTFDITTMLPELSNTPIRQMEDDVATLLPSRMLKNISYDGIGCLFYYPGNIGFWCYQADELYYFPNTGGNSISIKLPPMPAGTYQLCLGVVPMAQRGVLQLYIDDEPCGEPVDLRKSPVEGWFDDAGLTADEIIEQENQFREKGWMKGLNDYGCGVGGTSIMRGINTILRRIVGNYHTDGKTDHYLRIQPVDDSTLEMMLDYIQLTPKEVYEKELTYPYE